MDIKTQKNEDITIIELSGNLDGTTSEKALQQIEPFLVSDAKLIFDMQQCAYVSSAGLRILLMAAKQLKKTNGYGIFSGLSEEVNEVMEMTGFNNIFKNYATIDEAINAFRKE